MDNSIQQLHNTLNDFVQGVSDSLDAAAQSFKPKPDPRRESFPAGLPKEFRMLWEMTENWDRWTAPHYMVNFEAMSHEMSDLADDGTTSKRRCKEQAERQLCKAYTEAERFLSTGEDGMSALVLERLKGYLTEQFHRVHHLLRLMSGIPGIQDELGKIRETADFARIEDIARTELEKIVGSEHRLSNFSDYADDIEYFDDNMDMEEGFLRILEKAFVRYNFDGSEAYFKIREDTQSCYDMYRDQVDWFMPQLLSTTYSRRVREYLEEIEVKFGAGKMVG